MNNIENLLIISKDLKIKDIENELNLIKERFNNENSTITIPIVGEFSSGKTTLLNALSNNKKLETSSKPTTSVIYEVFFGNEKEYAELVIDDGTIEKISDISTLKNDELKNVETIRIYDTSKSTPDSTILVDTPGLSSNDPKHKEALSKYLPNSDALILCIDINQQVTSSLLDFIDMNKLSHLPIYIVLTKTDTKTKEDIAQAKKYIQQNINLPSERVICISSVDNKLDEFYGLMKDIQTDKNRIIQNVLNFRLNSIKSYLKEYIHNLLENMDSDKALELELKEQQSRLKNLSRGVDRLIFDTENKLEDIKYDIAKEFKSSVSNKLDGIISSRDTAMDAKAVGIINSVSNITISNFKNEIRRELHIIAKSKKNTDFEVPLRSLESINVEELSIAPLTYNVDLVGAGSNTVKTIAIGLKVAAAVGAVAVTVATVGAAAPAVAGAAGTGAVGTSAAGAIGTGAAAINTIDAATDVASIVSNVSTKRKILKTVKNLPKYKDSLEKNIKEVEKYDAQVSQIIPNSANTGFIENMVGKISDSTLGKPQRKKIIDEYLDNTLIPEFKSKLNEVSYNLLQSIKDNLNNEAETTILQYENKLSELKELFKNEKEIYKNTIASYKKHINLLNK